MYYRAGNWRRYSPDSYVRVQIGDGRVTTGYRGSYNSGGVYYDSYRPRSSYDSRYYGNRYGYGDRYYGNRSGRYGYGGGGRGYDRGSYEGYRAGSAIGGAIGGRDGARIGGAIGGAIGD